uniref:Uncharacterized protein AlNc14C116G6547 n=1 Tax=Albugo laibachii Nc14 TaxID=890382 RepID=F0WJ14_9STRA|nr:conserved hypothetical protein [Albugo laibachii Nc14]|eukprot:CCA21260.1 conserved hypothetical protein [Albugo laibachii Nc14]
MRLSDLRASRTRGPPQFKTQQKRQPERHAIAKTAATRTRLKCEQKRALREHHAGHPDMTRQELSEWAASAFKLPRPVARTSLSDLLKRQDDDTERNPLRKATHCAHSPELEAQLVVWINRCEELKIPIATAEAIRQKAEMIRSIILNTATLTTAVVLSKLMFSKGWLYRFQQRQGLKSGRTHGEADLIKTTAIENGLRVLQAVTSLYDKKDIFNMDEIANIQRCSGQVIQDMSALEIKDLGVVNKFFGLRISLDEEAGYVLDQEVSIDLLSKEYGLETANGVTLDGALYETGCMFCGTKVDSTNAQSYYGRVEDGGAYFKVLEGDQDDKVADRHRLKQTGVSLSTMEAEFFAASHAGRKLLGLTELFRELAKKREEYGKCQACGYSIQLICHYAHTRVVQPIFAKSGEVIADLLTKDLVAPGIAERRDIFNLKITHSTGEEECAHQCEVPDAEAMTYHLFDFALYHLKLCGVSSNCLAIMELENALQNLVRAISDKAVQDFCEQHFTCLMSVAITTLESKEQPEQITALNERFEPKHRSVALELIFILQNIIQVATREHLTLTATPSHDPSGLLCHENKFKDLPKSLELLFLDSMMQNEERISCLASQERLALPKMDALDWRVVKASGTNPSMVIMRVQTSDKHSKYLRFRLREFHQLRYKVAKALDELNQVEARPIMRLAHAESHTETRER